MQCWLPEGNVPSNSLVGAYQAIEASKKNEK
jgi:hypothetical protein